MVVVVPRVAGDTIAGVRVILRGEVIQCERDDGATAGEDLAGIATAFDVSFEPAHVTGVALLDPIEIVVGVRRALRGGDAAIIKAELPGDELDVSFDRFRCHSGWEK
mgnify:CR=1 FL=1